MKIKNVPKDTPPKATNFGALTGSVTLPVTTNNVTIIKPNAK